MLAFLTGMFLKKDGIGNRLYSFGNTIGTVTWVPDRLVEDHGRKRRYFITTFWVVIGRQHLRTQLYDLSDSTLHAVSPGC
jgi:hypothetical protein